MTTFDDVVVKWLQSTLNERRLQSETFFLKMDQRSASAGEPMVAKAISMG